MVRVITGGCFILLFYWIFKDFTDYSPQNFCERLLIFPIILCLGCLAGGLYNLWRKLCDGI